MALPHRRLSPAPRGQESGVAVEDHGMDWLSLATLSVLMFPLDVANLGAWDERLPLSFCGLAIHMREPCFFVYIVKSILVFSMTPFAVFYFDAGSERTTS